MFEQLAEANKRHITPGQRDKNGRTEATSNKGKQGKERKGDGNKGSYADEKQKKTQEEDEIKEYDDNSSKEETDDDNDSVANSNKDEQGSDSYDTQEEEGSNKEEEEEDDYDLLRALPRHLRGKRKQPPSPAKSTNSDEPMLDGNTEDKTGTPDQSDRSVDSNEDPDTPTKSNRRKREQGQKKTKDGQTAKKAVNPYFNRKEKTPQMYTKTTEELNGREKIERYDLRVYVQESNDPVGMLRDTLLGILTQLQQADPAVALCPYHMENKKYRW